MTDTLTINTYDPILKQQEAHLCQRGRPEVCSLLYGGAKGGGKSVWLCWEAFRLCKDYPGNKIWMGRKRAVDFNKTTLETFKREISPALYDINEQKKIISWKGDIFGGSRIFFGGMDNREDIVAMNSAEYGAGLCDQLEEFTQDDFAEIKGTLRWKLPNGKEPEYRMRCTANPSQKWIKSYFRLNVDPTAHFIQALPIDNPYLPTSYIPNLQETFKYRPELLRAFLEGSWDELDGEDIIIKMKDIERAVDRVILEFKDKFISVDCARMGDDETVKTVFQGYQMLEQEITSQKHINETAIECVNLLLKHKASGFVIDCDGVGGGLADILRGMGYMVIEIHSAAASSRPDRFVNLRAEMWFDIADKFYNGEVSILNDPELKRQLNAVSYKFATMNRLQVVEKEEIKKKITGKSPDRAESCVYGIWGAKHILKHKIDRFRVLTEDDVERIKERRKDKCMSGVGKYGTY